VTPQDAVERIGWSVGQAGMNPTKAMLYGNEVLVARTSQFRLLWFATKLHTFVVVSTFAPGTATPSGLDAFLRAAAELAKASKGGLPVGFQTGIAVLVVAVTEGADAAAHQWASASHGRQFAVLPFPVLVDTATGQVTRPQRMVLGGVYARYLKGLVDRHVAAPVQQGRWEQEGHR
jgi:hypothetical protein